MNGAPPSLAGKRVLVTGGSRGLGSAMCRAFAAEGARVAFTYRQEGDAARATLEQLAAFGEPGRAFQVAVTDAGATAAMVQELEQAWGGVDALVNNAGITQNLPLALMEEEDWDRVLQTNVKGAFLTSRAVLRSMIRRKRGAILNVGSLAGARMLAAPVHYCASKAALKGMTEALAKEVSRHGIRVNCIAPGLLEEGVGRNLPEHRLAEYLRHCSLGRVGTFAEVARLASFLVSDRSSYINGATIIVDGGV